jgi:hypothetical protein
MAQNISWHGWTIFMNEKKGWIIIMDEKLSWMKGLNGLKWK